MELLKDKICRHGRVIGDNIIKVDAFLNHQIDIDLLNKMGAYYYDVFKEDGITKILTIEASGIAIAAIAAQYFKVPIVFAKKAKSVNLDGEMLTASVHSFTKKKTYEVLVEKRFLTSKDRLLIIDDFLAEGNACLGLLDIVNKSDAEVAGIGIAIEKGFQEGGKIIRQRGYKLCSLAIIDKMSETEGVIFR